MQNDDCTSLVDSTAQLVPDLADFNDLINLVSFVFISNFKTNNLHWFDWYTTNDHAHHCAVVHNNRS